VHTSSSPPKVSSPAAVVEKFFATISQQVALGCSSVVVQSFLQLSSTIRCASRCGFLDGVPVKHRFGALYALELLSLPGGVVFGVLECFSQV
jgi:hypothetical protein